MELGFSRIVIFTANLVVVAFALSGCAETATIQPVASSKSQFEGAVFHGTTATISVTPPGVEEYRVFQQGGTGFVSIQSVREDAEQRAAEFCKRMDKLMKPLRETTANPPYILGNFPRVEIIFGCIDKPPSVAKPSDEEAKLRQLLDLQKLRDRGVLTEQEFEREKATILNEP